jgi:hypothetical protein
LAETQVKPGLEPGSRFGETEQSQAAVGAGRQ